ncbi:MAG: TIGR03085 family metal-binding protein [Dermatophilaceae bacterium]
MTGLAHLERLALCSTFTRVGPDAPTLCEGWTARDLAAHLVLRERRPDAAAGVIIPFIPALVGHTQRVQDSLAEQSWAGLVDMVRDGPPGWNPTRVPGVDDAVNLAEFWVHHQDVLRGAPSWTVADRRTVEPPLEEALWARLRHVGQLLFRRAPVGVVLQAGDLGRKQVRGATKEGTVTLEGAPSELLLFAFGRGTHADVRVEGPEEATAALRGAILGL